MPFLMLNKPFKMLILLKEITSTSSHAFFFFASILLILNAVAICLAAGQGLK